MPVYLYEHIPINEECTNDHEFEITQPITEPALSTCPVCGFTVKRLIAGSIGINWKGGAPTPKHYR